MTDQLVNWFVSIRKPQEIWKNHPTFLVCELVFYLFTILTFSHAWRSGKRYLWLWFTTILHGLVVESLSYFVPDIDNFWHAQSMVMFLGGRLPLHIIYFYPIFIYTACVSVSKMNITRWAEPFAVGLAVVLIDVPFDIMGIKLLWWSWHDTDPNIYDRHYWVPWTSYYFHAAFASSFFALFHGTRYLLTKSKNYESSSFIRELVCSIVTGLFAMPLGITQFLPLYHSLHDFLHIHTEVCTLTFLAMYALIVWCADRQPNTKNKVKNRKGWFDEIPLMLIIHFILYILLAIFSRPENNRVSGIHEEIGDCKVISPVQTAFGHVLQKRKFLCATDYDEGYYDFHCLPGGRPPPNGSHDYTICGTPFANRAEYVTVITVFSAVGLFVFLNVLKYSGSEESVAKKKAKRS